MKRVLFVISSLKGGGAERTLSNIVTHLPDEWYIDILVNDIRLIDYPYKGNVLSLSLKDFKKRKTVIYFIREVIQRTVYLRKIKKENNYDACISFLPSANFSNVLSGNKYCKTIVSIHGDIFREAYGGIGKIGVFLCMKVLYFHADKIITVSKEIALGLISQLKLPEDKVDTIVNGYDRELIHASMVTIPKNEKIRNLLRENQKIVITVGRMVDEKGQWHLIRAFSTVAKQEPEAILLVIGEGYLKQYLTELVKSYGLEKNILFVGYCDNPFWYNGIADVFVLPSLSEGYPNALVEAVCCGLPCIASDVHSGVREVLAPGLEVAGKRTRSILEEEYGILIPVCSGRKYQHKEPLEFSEQKMAEAIVTLLRHNEKRLHYKQKSIERSKELDIKKIVEKWIDVISE